MPRDARDCTTKQHVRDEIDRIDGELVEKLAERFGYVRRMAELKTDPGEALAPARIEEVLHRVAAAARQAGFDETLARQLWAAMIDWNIAFERAEIAGRLQDR